ncbi:MAG: c-type cytochrome [Solirubrobacterales bacterium]|nr:c-type cytochrome [Solirubrobacterales bacterium]
MRGLARTLALLAGAVSLLALGGCAIKHPTGNVVRGKQLFVAHCASCHTLAHAQATGTVGPNLDDAFRQDRADGVKSTSIEGLISYWIEYPNSRSVMPARLVTGQDAQDIAAYVSQVAAMPGQDTGALASAVASVSTKPAVEKNGVVEINANPNGLLRFQAASATATAGKVTLRMQNMSSVQHDIAVKGNGVNEIGAVVANGGVSTVSTTLKPGTYQFYCSVDGHAAAGMKGTLTVK